MMKLYCYYLNGKTWFQDKITEERGDTNFISLIIILAIVLGLAVIFSKNISDFATNWWGKITGSMDQLQVPSV